MATKMGTPELLEVFEKMTVLELKEFLDAFEEKFEVTAAAPMAVAAAGGGAAAAAPVEEEKDEFTVMLTGAGEQKIQVIKEVRSLTSLGLREAKELVDTAPKPVLENVDKATADKAKAQLEAPARRSSSNSVGVSVGVKAVVQPANPEFLGKELLHGLSFARSHFHVGPQPLEVLGD